LSERCEHCGANLALVGRLRRCLRSMVVTKVEPVTKRKRVTKVRSKRIGRPPLSGRAMTAADRKRRQHAKRNARDTMRHGNADANRINDLQSSSG
jgi:hypothetical protein